MRMRFNFISKNYGVPLRVHQSVCEELNDLLSIIAAMVDGDEYDDDFLMQPLSKSLKLWITELSDNHIMVEKEDIAEMNLAISSVFKDFLREYMEKNCWPLFKIEVMCAKVDDDRTLVRVLSLNTLDGVEAELAEQLTDEAAVYMEKMLRLLF